jgi:hypothetical protein
MSRKPRRGTGTTRFLTRRGPGRSGGSVPTVPPKRIVGDGYRQPKARGMWVRGDSPGECSLQLHRRMLSWALFTAPTS